MHLFGQSFDRKIDESWEKIVKQFTKYSASDLIEVLWSEQSSAYLNKNSYFAVLKADMKEGNVTDNRILPILKENSPC